MKKFLLSIVCLSSLLSCSAAQSAAAQEVLRRDLGAEEMQKLIFVDDEEKELVVPTETCKKFITLANLIGDLKEQEEPIPVTHCTKQTFEDLVNYVSRELFLRKEFAQGLYYTRLIAMIKMSDYLGLQEIIRNEPLILEYSSYPLTFYAFAYFNEAQFRECITEINPSLVHEVLRKMQLDVLFSKSTGLRDLAHQNNLGIAKFALLKSAGLYDFKLSLDYILKKRTKLFNSEVLPERTSGGEVVLDLSRFSLTSLEGLEKIRNINKVTRLILTANRLTAIDASDFACCPRLQYLYLGYNQLTELSPITFAQLPYLRCVHLNHNLFKSRNEFFLKNLLGIVAIIGIAGLAGLRYNDTPLIAPLVMFSAVGGSLFNGSPDAKNDILEIEKGIRQNVPTDCRISM